MLDARAMPMLIDDYSDFDSGVTWMNVYDDDDEQVMVMNAVDDDSGQR